MRYKSILIFLLISLIQQVSASPKNTQDDQAEVARFVCGTDAEFQSDIEALKRRLARVRKKDYSLQISGHAAMVTFRGKAAGVMELEEIFNSGRIEIMEPADPNTDPSIKNTYEVIAKINEEILSINKRHLLQDYLWSRRLEFTMSDEYDIDIREGVSIKDTFSVRQPVQVLFFKKKPLIGPEHIETISYYKQNLDGNYVQYGLHVKLNTLGKSIFAAYTKSHKGVYLPMYINQEFLADPMIIEPIESGNVSIRNEKYVEEYYKIIARLRKNEFYKCRVIRT